MAATPPHPCILRQWYEDHLVSLIIPKRIDPITWYWSHFENVLKENMVHFQNEGWGALRDPTGAPKVKNGQI